MAVSGILGRMMPVWWPGWRRDRKLKCKIGQSVSQFSLKNSRPRRETAGNIMMVSPPSVPSGPLLTADWLYLCHSEHSGLPCPLYCVTTEPISPTSYWSKYIFLYSYFKIKELDIKE